MGSLSRSGEFDDVVGDSYVSNTLTVGVTEVEAKVGASRLDGREILTIQNLGNTDLYYGPTGVTTANGTKIFKKGFASIPIGDQAVYLISSAAGGDARIQEFA